MFDENQLNSFWYIQQNLEKPSTFLSVATHQNNDDVKTFRHLKSIFARSISLPSFIVVGLELAKLGVATLTPSLSLWVGKIMPSPNKVKVVINKIGKSFLFPNMKELLETNPVSHFPPSYDDFFCRNSLLNTSARTCFNDFADTVIQSLKSGETWKVAFPYRDRN